MRSLLILAAATAALVAAPAIAQNAYVQDAHARNAIDVPATIRVRHADLDLGTPGGIAMLDRRIRAAVEEACGATSDADPAGKNRVIACRKARAAEVRTQRERVLVAASSGKTVLASNR